MKAKTTLLGGAGLLLNAGLLAAPAKPNIAWEIDADNGHLLNSMNKGLGHPEQ
ncbi:MAG: hypothetical protein LAT65_14420 [Saccharospirillum sp.]|nr:hypothetical protein [Saccharospirillum sp.]